MIEEGAFKVNLMLYWQHVFTDLDAGQVGFKPGLYMASADEIYLNVKEKGGHAAMPHENVIGLIAVILQQIVSRNANVITPSCVFWKLAC